MENNTKNLMKLIEEKEGLQEKLLAFRHEAEAAGSSKAQFAQGCQGLLKENGIEITPEEILAFIEEQSKIELSADDLEHINGGTGDWCYSSSREKFCEKAGSCLGICADGSTAC